MRGAGLSSQARAPPEPPLHPPAACRARADAEQDGSHTPSGSTLPHPPAPAVTRAMASIPTQRSFACEPRHHAANATQRWRRRRRQLAWSLQGEGSSAPPSDAMPLPERCSSSRLGSRPHRPAACTGARSRAPRAHLGLSGSRRTTQRLPAVSGLANARQALRGRMSRCTCGTGEGKGREGRGRQASSPASCRWEPSARCLTALAVTPLRGLPCGENDGDSRGPRCAGSSH